MTNDTVRDRLPEILDRLKAELAQPNASLLPVLTLMSRLARYSLGNQLLIYAQCPTATDVRGFQTWRAAGYCVRKGERGIAIYAPVRRTFRTAANDAAHTDVTDDAPARERTSTTQSRLGFRVAYVFDRRQVEPIGAETLTVEAPPAPAPLTCLEQLKAWLVGHNVELVYHRLPDGCYGATTGARILCTTGLTAATEFSTLAHETAHVLLHFSDVRPDSLTVRETEAEAVAYVLCRQFGLDEAEQSVAYIRAYRGTPDTLEASLERIRAVAARLADELAAIRFAGPP